MSLSYNFLQRSTGSIKSIVSRNCSGRVNMSLSSQTCRVAALQVTCSNDKAANLAMCSSMVRQAAGDGARVIFLPEAFDFIAGGSDETRLLAESVEGATIASYRQLARELGVWLSLGGFHERVGDRLFNTHLVVTGEGDVSATYRKTHLFDTSNMRESDYISPGSNLPPVVLTPAGRLSPMICYDLRFPEISLIARSGPDGAQLLSYPSAFLPSTGEAHWLPLIKARAIETQCYVVAATQAGKHPGSKRASHGQAVIVDPWGHVMAEAPAACFDTNSNCQDQQLQQVITADIDLQLLDKVRADMPVANHRRHDLYLAPRSLPCMAPSTATEQQHFTFGPKQISGDLVFMDSALSYAFVNRRCVVPGHVLVAPRCSQLEIPARLQQLSPAQLCDLFCLAQLVQRLVERVFEAGSSTVCVQDGRHAGQTVPHVHIHVLPRREGDFAFNDDVYRRLHEHDREEKDQEDKWRDPEEMRRECQMLRDVLANWSDG